MKRYVGVRNDRIVIVSDFQFSDGIAVPDELSGLTSPELMSRVRHRDGKFVVKHRAQSAKQMKVAFVGNWKMRCGISSYSENLWPEVAQHVGEFRLFVEKNDAPTSQMNKFGTTEIPEDHVIQCWTRGESVDQLVREIQAFDPDIVWIQHEFGLWANARHWLSMMSRLADYRVIVTMHSVFHHKDKTIVEAAMPEIVVHLDGAKNVLKEEKKLNSIVHVIPHGCFPIEKDRLWNFYKSDHTIIQYGFGFRYKGFSDAIKCVSILKKKYSDVFLTILFSESPFNKVQHELYYNELFELVNELGVYENVAIIRGFQSDETINSYLKTNKIAIFPYVSSPEHEVFGVSGAARGAMTKGMPVVTTSVNHFLDIPSIKAETPEAMAQEIEKLYDSKKLYKEQVQKQNQFLEENSWEKIAQLYIELFMLKP